MRKGDTIPGALISVFGVIFLVATLMDSRMTIAPVTSDGVPGAGFFPFVMSLILILLGAVLYIKGVRQNGSVQYLSLTAETKQNLKKLLLVVVGLIIFLTLWQLTKLFFLWVFVFSIYLNMVFERSIKFTAIYSVSLTAIVYLVFTVAFSIQFK
ncbi:MAG: tripartite tricarboxylate transporter TctB family protein [Spirochaetales bacterium]|nr:tripartite tricarboxylate transporter TctB family protein [Spirochaetales bacterium]